MCTEPAAAAVGRAHVDMDAFFVSRRAAAPAGAARQAGGGRDRHRPAGAGRRDGRLLRGAPVRRPLRAAARDRAPALPAGGPDPARHGALPASLAQGDGRARAGTATGSRSPASTRPTSTSPTPGAEGLRPPAQARDAAETGPRLLGRPRAEQAAREDRLRPRQAGRLLRAGPERCSRRSATGRRADPRRRAERPPSGSRALGIRTVAELAARRAGGARARARPAARPRAARPRARPRRPPGRRPSASGSPRAARRPSRRRRRTGRSLAANARPAGRTRSAAGSPRAATRAAR